MRAMRVRGVSVRAGEQVDKRQAGWFAIMPKYVIEVKAFFRLYKIITPLHRSDLKIQQNFADTFLYFSRFFAKNRIFFTKKSPFFRRFQ